MTPRRLLARRTVLVSLAAGLALAPAGLAHADQTTATSMVVDARLDAEGLLHVEQVLTFPGQAPARVEQRLPLSRDLDESTRQVYEVTDLKAAAGPTELPATTSDDDGQRVVTVDTTGAGRTPVTVSYVVRGATRGMDATATTPSRTEFHWPLLQGLSVPVQQVRGSVATPGTITFIDCESGPVGRLSPCNAFGAGTHESPQPTFSDGPRAAGDQVTLELGLPEGLVADTATLHRRWTLGHAFSVTPLTLAASLLPLLAGGALLWWLHRRHGRDVAQAGHPTPVAEFRPVGHGQSSFTVLGDVRPGHVGTVADERVDPVDVTATLLDLAVRGWLRIVELPRERAHQALDWRLERREGGQGELRPFEVRLRDAVAPAGGRGVLVSHVKEAVQPVVGQVQDDLYAEVVERGWFDRRPDDTRSRYGLLGWTALALAVVVTGLLVAFTPLGLLGIALVVLALAAFLVGQEMPRRTAAGASLLGGMASLAAQLQTHPTNQLPAGREYQELSRLLPYAVVLGGRERWVDALVAADDDTEADPTDLDWYHAPADWHLRDLPDSLTALVVALQGHLYER